MMTVDEYARLSRGDRLKRLERGPADLGAGPGGQRGPRGGRGGGAHGFSYRAERRAIQQGDGARPVDLSSSGQAWAGARAGFIEDHRGRSSNQDEQRVKNPAVSATTLSAEFQATVAY